MSKHTHVQIDQFSQRTTCLVGRVEELATFNKYLHARGEKNYLYVFGPGGLGKTRLLEELQHMVAAAGPEYVTAGIIDLYHTETHSPDDIEHMIVQRLDRQSKYFKAYLEKYSFYKTMMQRGANPVLIEETRSALTLMFINGVRDMASDVRKIVLCFDTLEQIQLESSVVEEKIDIKDIDTGIRHWLLSTISKLPNVLVVFAGRPKQALKGDKTRTDPQQRLIKDMETAFEKHFEAHKLSPLTVPETRTLIDTLSGHQHVIPEEDIPIICKLTGGRPILIHLVFDLIFALSQEAQSILSRFKQFMHLVDAADTDPELINACQEIENQIVNSIIGNTGEIGGYLTLIAQMPKGVDREILDRILGLPEEEGEALLTKIRPLSFVKTYHSPIDNEEERIFLHDEMYRLINEAQDSTKLRISERSIARNLITNYYDVRICDLKQKLAEQPDATAAFTIQDQLYKLQADQFYYQLVQNPVQGYAAYKKLSYEAAMLRARSFAIQILDEFLRFYNTEKNNERFEQQGISRDQFIRENTQLWVERFHWWGQYETEIAFARYVLDHPAEFSITPEDKAILGTIQALVGRAITMREGYQEEVVVEGKRLLESLPPMEQSNTEELLARARLCTTIGYACRWSGRIDEAASNYEEGLRAIREVKQGYTEEHIILSNNMVFICGKQGRFYTARILAREAIKLSANQPSARYSYGLSLTNLASVERLSGNHYEAQKLGLEAEKLFTELSDPHGLVRAKLNIGSALRQIAEREFKSGSLDDAFMKQEEACKVMKEAVVIAEGACLASEVLGLKAELGKIHRGMGKILTAQKRKDEAITTLRQGEAYFRETLDPKQKRWFAIERADIQEDLAELLYIMGDYQAALKEIDQLEKELLQEVVIIPGVKEPEPGKPSWWSLPAGKAESLRGKIDFEKGSNHEGMRHFILAYVHFQRYSESAAQIPNLLETLFDKYINHLPMDDQMELLKYSKHFIQKFNYEIAGVNLRKLVNELELLIGV